MNDREIILNRVRESLQPLTNRSPYPEYDVQTAVMRTPTPVASIAERFASNLKAVNGVPIFGWQALADFLGSNSLTVGYCHPSFMDTLQNLCPAIKFIESHSRSTLDSLEFGISPAAAAIAETGSIVLIDEASGPRLAALAPWTHIAVIEESRILPDVPCAIKQFGTERNIIFVTGPSKTADVEGILIEGVHGPGVQVCCII